MNLIRLFLLRSSGAVLIASGVAAVFLHERWGTAAPLCLLWGCFWAIGLGVLGFRSLRRALTCKPQRMAAELLIGVVQRAFLLFASTGLVYLAAGVDWSLRALITTFLLYLVVLVVEIITLSQGLKAGLIKEAPFGAAPSAAASGGGVSENGGVSESPAGASEEEAQ